MSSETNVIPRPVHVKNFNGECVLSSLRKISAGRELLAVADYTKALLEQIQSMDIQVANTNKNNNDTDENQSLLLEIPVEKYDWPKKWPNEARKEEEAYTLVVGGDGVAIRAKTPAGVFYGVQTLYQLVALDFDGTNPRDDIQSKPVTLPALSIVDWPRFPYRGFMLDEGRHFHGKVEVKKLFDLMALYKLNRFHWHLTDDQGWRIEIKQYPKLTTVGSTRTGTAIGGYLSRNTDGIPHTGFYTQEDIREIVQYAHARFIQVIPEIDVPGHTRSALAAYPELGCTRQPTEVSTHWGIHKDVMCPGKDAVFDFVESLLREICELFPSEIIHIGGDEVPKTRWEECPDCQERIAREGLADEHALQVYFTNRVINILKTLGRRAMGWNEILADNLEENVICQYWLRHKDVLVNHINRGREVVMSNYRPTYLNKPYGFSPLRKAYDFEPIPEGVQDSTREKVLGLESPLWCEFIASPRRLEWQTFPRLLALAEVGWTPPMRKDYNSFVVRLEPHLRLLDQLGVHHAEWKDLNPGFFRRLKSWVTIFGKQVGGE